MLADVHSNIQRLLGKRSNNAQRNAFRGTSRHGLDLLVQKGRTACQSSFLAGEARSRRCVAPIHGREVPRGLQILMKVPDRIAQSARKSQAPKAREGSPASLPKVAN